MKKISYKKLLSFVEKTMMKVGVNKFSSRSVAYGLCFTSLRGVDSHGINLLPHYILSAINGRKNGRPKFKFKKVFPAMALLDADDGFGHAACLKAINYSVKVSKKYGISAVAIKNSSHCGALAVSTIHAAESGYICIGFTHADALVVPPNGVRPIIGTNPISFAFPRKNNSPICLDMATSSISWNNLISMNKKKKIPPYIAADKNGNTCSSTEGATALFPLGGEQFLYKGFCLGVIVELFCTMFSGMNYGRELLPMYNKDYKPRKLGQFFITMRADLSMQNSNYFEFIKKFSNSVYSERSKNKDGIFLPGDPEQKILIERKKNGIPIKSEFLRKIKKIEKQFSINFDLNL